MLVNWNKLNAEAILSLLFSLLLTSQLIFARQRPISTEKPQHSIVKNIKKVYQNTGIGAVAYILVEKDQIVSAGGFGQYSRENKKQVTENSLFRVGSITKTFTALAIMEQVEKGKLKLTQAIKYLVKDLPLSNPYKNTPVTIEMLLEHTSGLQDLTRKEFDFPRPLSLEQAFKVSPESRQVLAHPGYHFSYSNAGAGYLGRVIEVINDVDYDQWFKTEILIPMGMKHSTLKWSETLEAKLVSGYDADLNTEIPYWHTLFRSFGGLNTTAMDMGKLLLLFTRDRKFTNALRLSNKALARMERPLTSLGARAGLKQGYALGIRNQLFKGHRIYGHSGDADGYLAQFSYSKESHRGYFFVINAFRHDIDEKFTFLLNQWLVAPLKPSYNDSHKNEIVLSELMLKQISGNYVKITSRFPGRNIKKKDKVSIKIKGTKILICFRRINNCQPLFAASKQLFKTQRDSEASIAIVKAGDGKTYLQWGSDSYQKISSTVSATKNP